MSTCTPLRLTSVVFAFLVVVATSEFVSAMPQSPPSSDATMPAAPAATAEHGFPRDFDLGDFRVTVYPPTFKSWDGHHLTGTCAISITPTGGQTQEFGTLSFSATTEVNRPNRMVKTSRMEITGVSIPADPASQDRIERDLERQGKGKSLNIALDRLEAAVPSMQAAPSVPVAPLKNTVPALTIATTPTVLVPIQGDPVFEPIPQTSLTRVMNTSMFLLKDGRNHWWLRVADGWLTAETLAGPWGIGGATADLATAMKWVASRPQINLLAPDTSATTDAKADKAQTVSLSVMVPAVVVATGSAEILVVDGAPAWTPIPQAGLSYVTNTSANIFRLDATGACFVLVSGRWFTGPGIGGPWTYAAATTLPTAFLMIPADSPKENVLASIPGTAQAQEAAIANTIPQMARVPLNEAFPTPTLVGGAPQWTEVVGTIGSGKVEAVANCATPVFRTEATTLWAVEKGVWFTAPAFAGPWKVATWVAPVLYTIPPSSPYYYVTFVRVYNAGPDYVSVGYTPGYFGAYVQDGVIVYGTGYWYSAYCVDGWVPVPMTYGYGACMTYNPWAGWAFGFGAGMAVGWAIGANTWRCGPYPCWGPYWGGYGPHGAYAWGPGGWAATTGNVYHQWGNVSTMTRTSAGFNAWTGNSWATHTGMSYNSATGARAVGHSGVVENAYTGNWAEGARGAGYNPSTGNYGRGAIAASGDRNGTEVVAGAGTIGNTRTGESVSAAGVRTENGQWGVASTSDGKAVSVGNNVYATHDGGVYKYDEKSDSWNQYDKGGWSDVGDTSKREALHDQAATRADGDWRSSNSARWQSGGEGLSGRASESPRTSGGNWGGNYSGGGAGRLGRTGGGGRGGRR